MVRLARVTARPFSLTIVGGGNMGAALAGGLVRTGIDPAGLAIVEVLAARRDVLATELPGVTVVGEMPASDGAVIAVKPYDVPAAIGDAVAQGVSRILSIAAGVSLATMEDALGTDGRERGVVVIRSMPNTPALVGEGASAIAGGTGCAEADLAWAEGILGAVGSVVRVAEPSLDAVTGLAGSGPAYLFLVAEALIDAGVLAGLPRATAEALVAQLFVGSSKLLAERGTSADGGPAALRAMVTSPAGTTAAGLHALESAGVRAAFLDAVSAATARSRELGRAQ
jgi:pyrroline-5-carboxylate reductase